ncbi:MAG: hypothetical protein JHC95_16620 [Solirubrobacteraceae bacterium]|nr:hypothetical protein [Solirubrobacteraceae bacterium]
MTGTTADALIGRSAEVHRVARAVAAGRSVLIIGEPGVGKTTLARAGATAANVPRIWEGGGIAMLDWVSYLPFRRALGLDLPDGDASVVADFISDQAGSGVFLVDDLQWVDQDTITATLLIAERLPVVGVVRESPRGHKVRDRLAAAGFEVLELGPLDDADATLLAQAHNAALTAGDAAAVARRARGNPLMVQGLAHAGERTDELALALRARLGELSVPAREALHRIAVLERPARMALAPEDLRQLTSLGLIVETHEGVQVSHALIASAVLDGLPAEALAEVHRQVARNLDDPGEAARHWAAAGDRGHARALAQRAATTTERPVERARCAALAAECLEGPGRDEELVAAMGGLAAVGDFARLVDLSEHVSPDSDVLPEAQRLRARGLFEGEDAGSASDAIEAGLSAAKRLGDEAGRVRLELTAGYHGMWSTLGSLEDTSAVLAVFARAQELGVADAEMHVLAAAALVVLPGPDAALLARRGRELARAGGDVWSEHTSWLAEASACNNQEGGVKAAEISRQGAEELTSRGYRTPAVRLQAQRADLLAEECEYAAALGLTEEVLARPALLGNYWDMATWSRAIALNDIGRTAEADGLFDELQRVELDNSAGYVAWIHAESLWARGDALGAMRAATAGLERMTVTVQRPQIVAVLARAQWEYGAPQAPDGRLGIDGVTAPYEAESDALYALQMGASANAVEAFETAIALGSSRRHRLRCRLGLAEAVDRIDPERATTMFETVSAELAVVGWTVLHKRVVSLIDQPLGTRRLKAVPPAATGALTAREHDVLTLVADGQTSREISERLGVSLPTVETHIRSAKRKLGAKTRAEAAAARR